MWRVVQVDTARIASLKAEVKKYQEETTQIGTGLRMNYNKLKEEYNFHKSWNKEERVEKRVGSWREFGASGKNKKPRVGSNWKPEENHTAAGAGVDVTGGEKGYRHDWK